MKRYILRDLVKMYNGRRVLDIPSLSVQVGELLAVVGPSGAGKSTLLRLLHFLEMPTSGEVAYSHDSKVAGLPAGGPSLETRRKIGMVFQRPEMMHGSVRENVALGLNFRQIKDNARVAGAMAQVDIKHLADASVDDLSGGELQRVALARVIAVRPETVLFDEPTANLDPANVFLVERIIRDLHAGGTTIVLVTHNIFQARRLADRVAFLLDGRLVEISAVEKFFSHPEDERSRAFVRGEMIY